MVNKNLDKHDDLFISSFSYLMMMDVIAKIKSTVSLVIVYGR